jgi:hypothetical protein
MRAAWAAAEIARQRSVVILAAPLSAVAQQQAQWRKSRPKRSSFMQLYHQHFVLRSLPRRARLDSPRISRPLDDHSEQLCPLSTKRR